MLIKTRTLLPGPRKANLKRCSTPEGFVVAVVEVGVDVEEVIRKI
jgi:hypothetical protein